MKTAYTDIATADLYATSTAWTGSDDTAKDQALLMASMWIDKHYSCTFETPVQDEIQAATALLGEQYILGTLFVPRTDSIKRKSVKAGSVTTTKEFVSGDQVTELFPEVGLYLSAVSCSFNSHLNIDLVRR